VAGDSPKCRDLVLSHGALPPLLAQLNEHAKLSMLRNATWTLSNFCRGKPQPAFEQTKPALPALERLIHSNDEEVLTDACWALSYLSDGTNDKIQAVIEAGVCRRLVELLLHPSPSVLIPALRTVGNIVTGDDVQTQYIINNQALPCLLALLPHNHKKSIKKEACWTISNNKHAGARVLLSKEFLLRNVKSPHDYKGHADNYIYSLLPGIPYSQEKYTPGGLLYTMPDSNLQYVTSSSFLLRTYAKYLSSSKQAVSCGTMTFSPRRLRTIAKCQVDYILGDNPLKMSYMVGYGSHYPKRIHHRAV